MGGEWFLVRAQAFPGVLVPDPKTKALRATPEGIGTALQVDTDGVRGKLVHEGKLALGDISIDLSL